MLGSVIVLDSHGFRAKASELQRLLQSIPHPLSAGGSDSDQSSEVQTGRVETLSLAVTLSWVIPDADCRMSTNSPGTGKKVTSKKQAIAIGLSEARKSGAKVPKK